jgi:Glyoxalase-like domain
MKTMIRIAMMFLLTATLSFGQTTQPLRIDHVPICVADLAPVQQAFAAAGLKADYGGPHSTGGTHMALLGFDDGSYFELLAPQKPGSAKDSDQAKRLEGSAGPCMWAVSTSDMKAELARLQGLGIAIAGPYPGGRTRPDGQVIKWETAGIGPGARGDVLPFLIQDYTAHNLRVQPSASVHGSVLSGITIVVVGVKDLAASIALFRKAYGWEKPRTEEHKEFGARLAHFAGTPVILATPLESNSWLAQRLEKYGDGPVAALVGASDWNQAAKKLPLVGETRWFGNRVAWIDPAKLSQLRIGVIKLTLQPTE